MDSALSHGCRYLYFFNLNVFFSVCHQYHIEVIGRKGTLTIRGSFHQDRIRNVHLAFSYFDDCVVVVNLLISLRRFDIAYLG